MSDLARIQRLAAENIRLRETLRLAQDGLLLAVIQFEEFRWPDNVPDYHTDGRARSFELGCSGEYESCRTPLGDRTVAEAIAVVHATLTACDELGEDERLARLREIADQGPEGGEDRG